jgi:hypothetical protein
MIFTAGMNACFTPLCKCLLHPVILGNSQFKLQSPILQSPFLENKKCGDNDEEKADGVVPFNVVTEIKNGKHGEDDKGDDFLNGFELGWIEAVAADAIGRHLKAVFKKSNAPAHESDFPERHVLVFEVAVPGEGHKHIRNSQKNDGGHVGEVLLVF